MSVTPTERYRYSLTREWTHGKGSVCWVMLNPSTADETKDDHTIRCVRRVSQEAGYQSLIVVNLFAARATLPRDLVTMAAEGIDPVGVGNGALIGATIETSDAVVFAWGASVPAELRDLAGHQLDFAIAASAFVDGPFCLGVTQGGHPRHPSRMAVKQRLVPFEVRS